MVRTINTEVGAIILVGFLLTVGGIYLNFQNIDQATSRHFDDRNALNNMEIIASMVQVIGMAVMFIGATRGLLRRSDVMANKFVNIMDVFTSLIKKEMEMIDSSEKKRDLKEVEERSARFKREMGGLRGL